MSRISWEALAFESGIIASDLSSKSFLPKKDWESYQEAANQLVKRFDRLSSVPPSLKAREIKQLRAQCHSAIETIRVRLEYFHPDKKSDVKRKFYDTQIEHLHLRLGQLKESLDEGLGFQSDHQNLYTPHNKRRLIKSEIKVLEGRIADIQRKQAALR